MNMTAGTMGSGYNVSMGSGQQAYTPVGKADLEMGGGTDYKGQTTQMGTPGGYAYSPKFKEHWVERIAGTGRGGNNQVYGFMGKCAIFDHG
jgi:hypothetical protein